MKGLLAVTCLAAIFAAAVLAVGDPGYTEDKTAKADAVTAATGSQGMGGTAEVNMKDVLEFAGKHRMGYFATVENGKPKVRAYSIMKIEGETIYFGTDRNGASYLQLQKVPYGEFVSMDPETYTTLRIAGEVKFVDDMELIKKTVEADPMLAKMYPGEKVKDFGMFYFIKVEPNWFGMWEFPEELQQTEPEEGEMKEGE